MKIAFFGSIVATGLFRLAGVQDCFEYNKPSDFTARMNEMTDAFGLVIISHRVYHENRKFVDGFRQDHRTPVIVEVHDYGGTPTYPEIYHKIRMLLGVESI